MKRTVDLVNERYDALMFAKSREAARRAAKDLVRVVLGDEALERPLEEALRECCRKLRPSNDPKERERFENEFVELAIWPDTAHKAAA